MFPPQKIDSGNSAKLKVAGLTRNSSAIYPTFLSFLSSAPQAAPTKVQGCFLVYFFVSVVVIQPPRFKNDACIKRKEEGRKEGLLRFFPVTISMPPLGPKTLLDRLLFFFHIPPHSTQNLLFLSSSSSSLRGRIYEERRNVPNFPPPAPVRKELVQLALSLLQQGPLFYIPPPPPPPFPHTVVVSSFREQ